MVVCIWWAVPTLRVVSSISQAALFGAIDLYDDAVLHDNVYRSEPQAAERIAYQVERVVGSGTLLGGRNLWLM